MRRITGLIVCLFSSCLVFSQTASFPKGYFRWPLNLKPEIVANLGELRPNHWHMGLDIRTNQQVNQLVFAAADGYIARVGIRPQSFGRFIVINHPNGLSTLYAHLNDFAPSLEKYVTDQQYEKQSWAVELEIEASRFPVKKGAFIANSGTTGGSQGPHVHFEIRDTKSGKCLNPLLFGFPLADNVKPSVVKLAMYDRTKSIYAGAPQFFALKNSESGYFIPKTPVIKTGADKVSFAIQAFDRISGSLNEDGIYSAALFVDEKPLIRFIIDSIDYNQTSYMNAHIDYTFRYNGGAFLQHVAKLPGDRGGVYHPNEADGMIRFTDTAVHEVRIEVRDAYQNKSNLNFSIQYKPELAKPASLKTTSDPFIPNFVNFLEKPDFEVYLPETCLYDTTLSYYYRSNTTAANAVSAMHQLNDESVPVEGNLRVRIRPDKAIPATWRDKIIIERTYRKSRTVRKAEWQGEWLSAEFGDFGYFQAFADIIPPSINQLGAGDTVNLSAARRIVFTPTDNFGIKSFRAELDGQWLRFTNDKSRNWIYQFDERCPDGIHELKIRVEDMAGNITEKTWWFKKYPYTPPPKKKAAGKKKTAKGKKQTVVTKKKASSKKARK